ncbi:MAG TPA: hypothetical protein VM890_15810 [Longimicrobium sp.]|jgi:hypothetical protein|nr:hypothetical protein [Longimicrobium sp.]
MSTIPLNPSDVDGAAATPTPADAPAKARRQRMRREGGSCGNCGFEDTGHYCSRCGEPLHGTQDTVLEILWSDMVEGPLHNLFALGKTTWLILVSPRHFFSGVLKRQRGLTSFPFFLAPAWRRVSHKPHGVPNAVKYFFLIYTLSFVGAWALGVDLFPAIPFRGTTLPGTFTEALILALVVGAAWMYAAAVSRLLGGRIDTEVLTKFMLYLNGFALIPLVGMAVAGIKHPWVFGAFLAGWLYALFVLPQTSLPKLFGISRARLGFAQAGAAVANVVMILTAIFVAGIAADYFGLIKPREGAASTASTPFNPAASGFTAWRLVAERTVFPDMLPVGLRPPGWPESRGIPSRRSAFERGRAEKAPVHSAGSTLFPLDALAPPVRFTADLSLTERRGRLRGGGSQ